MPRNLLVFQTAYTYAQMEEKDILDFFTSKDLDGYFDKVVTVNAFGEYSERSHSNGNPKVIYHNKTHSYIEATNSKYFVFQKISILNFLYSQVKLIQFLTKLLKDFQIDVIRGEDPRYNGILARYFSHRLKVPFVVGNWGNPDTIRNLTKKPMSPRMFKSIHIEKLVERYVFQRANFCIAQNSDNLNYIRQFGVPIEKLGIFRLGNAINPIHFSQPISRNKFDFKEKFGIEDERFRIVCVSALEKRKIIEDALQSFKIVNSIEKSHLILLGAGTHEIQYRQLAKDLGIEDFVTFAGMVEQELVSQILSDSNVILSPLTGRALAEGMLSGTPVVAYNVDCHPDFINDGENGFLVEYRDFEGMADKTLKLLLDPALSQKLGDFGRTTILESMDPNKLVMDQRDQMSRLFVYPKL